MDVPHSQRRIDLDFTQLHSKLCKFSILLLFFILPFRNQILISGDSRSGTSIAVLLGAVIGATWILFILSSRSIRKIKPFHLILALLTGWIGLTSFWAVNPVNSISLFVRMSAYTVVSLAIWDQFRTQRDVEKLFLAYLFGALLLLFFELGMYIITSPERLDYTTNPNYLSGRLLFAFPIAWLFVQRIPSDRGLLVQSGSVLYLLMAPIGIILTQSRQGLIALLAGVLFIFVLDNRVRKYLYTLPIILFALGIGAYRYLGERLVELSQIFDEIAIVVLGGTISDPTTHRVTIIDRSLELFFLRPIFGHGAGNFEDISGQIYEVSHSAHNSYLDVLVETGVVGLILLALLLLFLSRGIMNKNHIAAIPAMMILVIWGVLSLTNDWFSGFGVWAMFALILSSIHAKQ